MKLPKVAALLALLGAALAGQVASAQVVHVNAALATGANDGSSWDDAYQGPSGLRTALEAATPGTEVWVAGGTYLPTTAGNRCSRLIIDQDDVTLRGGFAGDETSVFERPERGQFPTYLSGDLSGNDPIATDNSSIVLFVDADGVTLDRIHVTGGGAEQLCHGPIIGRTAVVFANAVIGFTMVDCVIEECFGRGVRWAPFPSGQGPPSIRDCVFRDIAGAGVFSQGSSPGILLDRCRIENCGTGVVQIAWDDPELEFRNTLIRGCASDGISFVTSDANSALVTLRGCTIVENGGYGAAHYGLTGFWVHDGVDVKNSILWGNNPQGTGFGPQLFGRKSSWMRPENSIVQGGWPGRNVIDQAPMFVNPAGGDYSLLPGSPAIDQGRGEGAGPLDLARSHRAVDLASASNGLPGPFDVVDLGAFELSGAIGENGDCQAAPNSTGRPGRLFARGSTSAAANSLGLSALDLPPGQFGMFIVSRQLGSTPVVGGAGTLCLGGAIGRFNGPGEIQLTSASGELALAPDLTRLPQPMSLATVQPGETWRFQLWHRDVPQGGAPGSQLTGLVTVRFD